MKIKLVEEAIQEQSVLNEETLEDILDFAYTNQDELSLNFSWEEVYEKYQKEGAE